MSETKKKKITRKLKEKKEVGKRFPIGIDLAGWHIEEWFEVWGSNSEYENRTRVVGYFKDEQIAHLKKRGQGFWGSNGEVDNVLVLTKDGRIGFVLKTPSVTVYLKKEKIIQANATKKAKEKLSVEERMLLGIE